MILSAQTLRDVRPVTPFHERTLFDGMSFGLSYAGYDIRLRESLHLPAHKFVIGSSIEEFTMPLNVLARVHDKSSWVRRGVMVANTILEPGWRGFLTIEMFNQSDHDVRLTSGTPIAQVVFEYLDQPVVEGYKGKYQDQPAHPVKARREKKIVTLTGQLSLFEES